MEQQRSLETGAIEVNYATRKEVCVCHLACVGKRCSVVFHASSFLGQFSCYLPGSCLLPVTLLSCTSAAFLGLYPQCLESECGQGDIQIQELSNKTAAFLGLHLHSLQRLKSECGRGDIQIQELSNRLLLPSVTPTLTTFAMRFSHPFPSPPCLSPDHIYMYVSVRMLTVDVYVTDLRCT